MALPAAAAGAQSNQGGTAIFNRPCFQGRFFYDFEVVNIFIRGLPQKYPESAA